MDSQPAAHRTELEDWLLAEVAAVLEVDAVGLDDDFLAIGGNSISAVALTDRLRDRFGVVLPVVAIFDVNTLAELAELVRADVDGAHAGGTAAAPPGPAAG